MSWGWGPRGGDRRRGVLMLPTLDFATLVRVTDWPHRAVQDALDPSPERLKIFPSYSAHSFDEVVSLALMEPCERPRRRIPREPARQLSLLERVGYDCRDDLANEKAKLGHYPALATALCHWSMKMSSRNWAARQVLHYYRPYHKLLFQSGQHSRPRRVLLASELTARV